MPHPRGGDLQAVSRFLLDLHAATDLDSFCRVVVRGLRQLIGAQRCSFNYFDQVSGQAGWIADGAEEPTDPEVRDAAVKSMRRHPVVVHVRRTGDRRVTRLSDHITRSAFHRTPVYNNWYRHCRTEHQLTAHFPSDRGGILAVALSRDGRRDFDERDRAIGNALAPHLVAAYRAAHRASSLQQEIVQLTQGLECAKAGVILLTEDGRLHQATTLARQWLGDYFDDKPPQASRLPAPVADWLSPYIRVDASTGIAPPPRIPLVIEGDGRRLIIEILGVRPHWILLLAENFTEIPSPGLDSLGLTRRETDVLKWVAEGKRDGEVGTILGLSSRTVQHHLERIYRKLGVETRTAAAARALEVATTRH